MRKLAWICMLFVLLSAIQGIVLLGMLIKDAYASGIKVTLRNSSDNDLHDVALSFTGGSVSVWRLESGQHAMWKINPGAESHLELRFLDDNKKAYHFMIDCYFEPNYSGRMQIDVTHGFTVWYVDDIRGPYDGLLELLRLNEAQKPRTYQAQRVGESTK